MSRRFPFAALAVVLTCWMATTTVAGLAVPQTLSYLPATLLMASVLALAFALSWKLGQDNTYFLVFVVLLVLGGCVWLTRQADEPWMEKAERWVVVGPVASWVRDAYSQPQEYPQLAKVDDPLPEMLFPSPEETVPKPPPEAEVKARPKARSREPPQPLVAPIVASAARATVSVETVTDLPRPPEEPAADPQKVQKQPAAIELPDSDPSPGPRPVPEPAPIVSSTVPVPSEFPCKRSRKPRG